jgi:PAS domain S-box-containing protein
VGPLSPSLEPRRDLFEDRESIVWLMKPPGVVTAVTGDALRLLGHDPGRWLEPGFWAAIQEEGDRAGALATCRAVAADGVARAFEHRVLGADGSAVRFCTTVLAAGASDLAGIMRPTTRGRAAARAIGEGLNLLLETAPVAFFALDTEGRITLSEGKALESLGFRPGETVGRSVFELYGDDPAATRHIPRALAGDAFESTAVVESKGRFFETRWSPLRDDGGSLAGTVAIAWDVTDRVRADEALERQETLERLILDSVPALLWFKDDKNRFVKCNATAAAAVGRARSEIEGRRTEEVFPEEASGYFADDLEVMRTGTPRFGIIEPYSVATGEKRWFSTNKVPYRDAKGNVTGVVASATDITELKRAQEERERSLSLLNATLESTADGILVVDRAGKIVSLNLRFADMWGIPEAILAPRDDERAIAYVLGQVRDPDAFLAKVNALYAEPGAESHDVVEFRDGRVFERFSKPQRLGAEVVGRVWSFRDVTARRRAEEERNRLLVEERTARAAAEAAVERLGALQAVTEAILASSSLGDLLDAVMAKVRSVFEADLAEVLLLSESGDEVVVHAPRGGPHVGYRIPLSATNIPGRVVAARRPVVVEALGPRDVGPALLDRGFRSLMAAPLNVGERTIGLASVATLVPRKFTAEDTGLLGLIADRIATAIEQTRLREVERSARVAAEEAAHRSTFLADASTVLASSLEQERTIESAVRLAIPLMADCCVLDLVGDGGGVRRVAFCGPAPELSETARELVPDLEALGGMANVVRTGEPVVHDLRQIGLRSCLSAPISARGRALGAVTFCSTRPDRYGPSEVALAQEFAGRVAVAIDNARLFHEAQEALASAREAVHLRDEFLSIASHELRTPLTSLRLAVQGSIRLAERGDLASTPERIGRSLRIVERQSRRLTMLVSALLDATRITSGHLDLELAPVDLAGVVAEVLALFEDELAMARCKVTVRGDPSVVGLWDRSRVEQVVTNLVSNAMKYGAGHPIEVCFGCEEGRARLSVRDEGPGIEPALHRQIFERFKRGVSARHYGGLGLGLYIVRQIVEALGGSVHLESRTGAGSTFAVELPIEGPVRVAAAAA